LHGKLGVDPANLAINPAKKHQDADISFIFPHLGAALQKLLR